jgi:uncharacterized membrane protein YidH (DUF202 family)
MLAVERTRVAYDRTMLAWTRTATSLITFGFTIYKFFQIDIVARWLASLPPRLAVEQQAALDALDELQKEADQMRIYSKRG